PVRGRPWALDLSDRRNSVPPERFAESRRQAGRPGADETVMFVEGIRLFVVVLGTAAGFWAARNFGTETQGLGGMLGCLLGCVSEAVLELLGLSTRPLVRAQPFDARDGLLVDSSVVMDGQLLPLTRAGVLSGDLMVARFVLDEVQGFADATDDVKRRRARRGLETLDSLRREGDVRLFVLDDEIPEIAEVDGKLIALARRLQLRLLTNDGPLAR